jgi:glyoxylase-like metal-dependent hydrolase (beta-lactamase superfamily II)
MDRPKRLVVGDLQTNCYLAQGPAGLLIVDPGGEAERIISAARGLGVPAAAVLLTHGHLDHTAAAPAVAEALGVPVYAHQADRGWLAGRISVFGVRPPAVAATLFGDQGPPGGPGVKVIPTPGHTAGSVVYVVGGVALVGDTLFAGSVGRTDLPGGDEAALLRSLARMLEGLEHRMTLLPGHGGPTTLAAEMRVNPWVQEAAAAVD